MYTDACDQHERATTAVSLDQFTVYNGSTALIKILNMTENVDCARCNAASHELLAKVDCSRLLLALLLQFVNKMSCIECGKHFGCILASAGFTLLGANQALYTLWRAFGPNAAATPLQLPRVLYQCNKVVSHQEII
jgi:hypothetical protein